MTVASLNDFDEIWCVDFEFSQRNGNPPVPICLVATEVRLGRTIRVWEDELRAMRSPPYDTSSRSLFVAYYASAEFSCHLALGWELPAVVLDLFAEFRTWTNGLAIGQKSGLLAAAFTLGIDTIGAEEKDEMRDLAIRGGPWTDAERDALLDYCEGDVRLLQKMLEVAGARVDLPRAVLRGEYMKACARIERNGLPIDSQAHSAITSSWDSLKAALIEEIDADFDVYEGTTFRESRFERYLAESGIPWARHESGRLVLNEETFRQMSRAHPAISPLRELRCSLGEMRLSGLALGSDSRNRCMLSAFRSKTGRNQPSNTKFIFGPAVWMRGLIRPAPGWGMAYIDWSQQEFGIAAALSGDEAMLQAYLSGDPYLAFAKQAGAVPEDATKATHKGKREVFKQCVLGVQYSMGEQSLAERIGQPPCGARQLLEMHRRTYSRFWVWSQACVDHAMLRGDLWTTFGWRIQVGELVTPRTLMNFPMQANGAEMLRLACIFATQAGVRVCAPVHDALLIEAPIDDLDRAIHETQAAMARASSHVLGGLELRSDVDRIVYPQRYEDGRGTKMWSTVMRLLRELNGKGPAAA